MQGCTFGYRLGRYKVRSLHKINIDGIDVYAALKTRTEKNWFGMGCKEYCRLVFYRLVNRALENYSINGKHAINIGVSSAVKNDNEYCLEQSGDKGLIIKVPDRLTYFYNVSSLQLPILIDMVRNQDIHLSSYLTYHDSHYCCVVQPCRHHNFRIYLRKFNRAWQQISKASRPLEEWPHAAGASQVQRLFYVVTESRIIIFDRIDESLKVVKTAVMLDEKFKCVKFLLKDSVLIIGTEKRLYFYDLLGEIEAPTVHMLWVSEPRTEYELQYLENMKVGIICQNRTNSISLQLRRVSATIN